MTDVSSAFQARVSTERMPLLREINGYERTALQQRLPNRYIG